ncbi:hypothetical protein C7S20_07755 [Christiangramia fulva]|uniref:Uncharacterized protein n=1 Tax=Christiangramia fulva TaxID=2126553 RepID=A0A2R3Z4H5_9FLAO|nr:hypothetical protein C7S20_07755 [Christiangramia fulva]
MVIFFSPINGPISSPPEFGKKKLSISEELFVRAKGLEPSHLAALDPKFSKNFAEKHLIYLKSIN